MSDVRLQPLTRAHLHSLGAAGAAWAAALPALLEEVCRRWALVPGRPLPGGSASYVLEVSTAAGEPRVLKLVAPDPTLADESRTLRAADGRGYALLHAHDPGRRALLLERLGPSLEQSRRPPEQCLAVLADTLLEAWRLPVASAPEVPPGEDKASQLHRYLAETDDRLGHPCPPAVLHAALALAERRAAAYRPEECVVVHGDPHPANLLRVLEPRAGAPAGHVLVDPDGFRCERAYDVGVTLREWNGRLARAADPRALLEGWCALAAHRTGTDEQAVWEWAYVERVSTGLYVTALGADRLGRAFLDAAALLA